MKHKIIGDCLNMDELDSLVGDMDWDEVYSETDGEGRGKTEIDIFNVEGVYIKRIVSYGCFDWSTKYYHVELCK